MENLNFNKSNWKKVKFGNVVIEPKETCKNILAEGIEHVVGLEHIESGDIHLRNSESTEESTTFTKIFRKGDVLFGRRRAYLKKAAQAQFDGICSGDITVFRANKEKLLPELLPFIVNNDKFFDYAVKHSAGGLSPRVKFKDLANYEFLLPPKEEQAKLAELLWAMDEVIEREKEVLENLLVYSKSFANDHMTKTFLNKKIKLGAVCTAKQWKTIPIKDLTKNGYLVYGGNGIIGRYSEYNHEQSVIAVACRGEYCGRIHLTEPESYITGNSMCLDNLNTDFFDLKYLYYYLYYSNLDSIISGSAQPQITKDDIERFQVSLTDRKHQSEFVFIMDEIWKNLSLIQLKTTTSQDLQKSLINQIF